MNTRAASVRWRASARHVAVALTVALALAAAWPGQALAHAVLEHTTPHQSSSVTETPSNVQLDFNEPVEVSFGAVRVFDERGERVDTGKIAYPSGHQRSVTVALRDGLGRGVYTATYRVVSADGHPVSGGFAFGVGEQATAERDTPQVADLLARSSAGPAVEGVYGLVRGLHYAALLLLVGAVFFRLLIWPGDAQRPWPGRTLLIASVVGLLCSLAGIALQGALGAGVSLGGMLNSQVLESSLDTRTGHAWLLRSVIWVLLVIFVALYRGMRLRREAVALAVPVAALVGTLPYAGHADTQSPKAVLIPADVLHVLAAGTWFGGLVLLLVAFWPRGGAPLEGAASATARFSYLALPAMAVLATAGSVQAWFYLGSIGGFFDSPYGWALVAKIALVVGIIGLAAANRRRTAHLADSPVDADQSATSLRSAMRTEALLAVLVLGATATLVRAAPPATVNNGPVVRELDLGAIRLQMDIEPAKVGPNDYHLYLFDRRTGAQIDRVEELKVTLVQRDKNIGPIKLAIPRKGPAHYELRNSTLGVAGTWEATVTARVSAFDEYTAKLRFEVRR